MCNDEKIIKLKKMLKSEQKERQQQREGKIFQNISNDEISELINIINKKGQKTNEDE